MFIHYECQDCKNHKKKLYRTSKDILDELPCEKCEKGILERQLSSPSSKCTQIIDNGVQAKQVEVMDVVIEKETERMKNKDD